MAILRDLQLDELGRSARLGPDPLHGVRLTVMRLRALGGGHGRGRRIHRGGSVRDKPAQPRGSATTALSPKKRAQPPAHQMAGGWRPRQSDDRSGRTVGWLQRMENFPVIGELANQGTCVPAEICWTCNPTWLKTSKSPRPGRKILSQSLARTGCCRQPRLGPRVQVVSHRRSVSPPAPATEQDPPKQPAAASSKRVVATSIKNNNVQTRACQLQSGAIIRLTSTI